MADAFDAVGSKPRIESITTRIGDDGAVILTTGCAEVVSTTTVPAHGGRPREPARIITMAWGERYIADLLSLTIPALLAPGNIPAFARHFRCEFVIVTERRFFDRIGSSRVVAQLLRYCDLRLIPIDDLLSNWYGITLTFALVRGFADLGEAMTDTHLIFLNADFIVADGSYAKLAEMIQAGARLAVSPSYCMVLEDTVERLMAYRDPGSGALRISRREMAALIIEHRHNTIRAKTANQRLFRIHRYDQFYWYLDEMTMLARQMPIAVVYMRPERVITKLPTFWDYGVISQCCPSAVPCVLGDSDDFLMGEMRTDGTFSELLHLGWPSIDEIAADLSSFTTKDHRDYGRHVLRLHAGNLPEGFSEEEQKFRAFIADVDRRLATPIDDVNHPFWVKDIARFEATSRENHRKMLADIRAEKESRPLSSDRIENTGLTDSRLVELEKKMAVITKEGDLRRRRQNEQNANELACINAEMEVRLKPLYEARARLESDERQVPIEDDVVFPDVGHKIGVIRNAEDARQLAAPKSHHEVRLRPKFKFAKSDWFGLLGSAYRSIFGSIEHTTNWHPLHASFASAQSVISSAIKAAQHVLIVSPQGTAGALISASAQDFTCRLNLSPRIFRSEFYVENIIGGRKFDLIVCGLGFSDLVEFREHFEPLRKLLPGRGKIIVFHLNENMRALDTETYNFTRTVFPLVGRSNLRIAGSLPSALAMKLWHWGVRRNDVTSIRGSVAFAVVLALAAPLARLANWLELRHKPGHLPRWCTSVTIEIDLP